MSSRPRTSSRTPPLVLDVRVKRGAELPTDHHLVVCSLRLSKPWLNRKSNWSSVAYRIKWEALEGKEERQQLASSISSKFIQLLDVSNDIEKEWLLFRSAIILVVAKSCGRKQLRVAGDSEKRTRWWNQEVKEVIRAKTDTFKTLLQDKSSSDLQSGYIEARKAATSAIKKSKEKPWEEFGYRLNSNYFSANKLFWQIIRRLRGERSIVTYYIKVSAGNILTDKNEILLRWRKYFEDLLNPVKASVRDTHKAIHLGNRKFSKQQKWQRQLKGFKLERSYNCCNVVSTFLAESLKKFNPQMQAIERVLDLTCEYKGA